jgi:hypothetical protein
MPSKLWLTEKISNITCPNYIQECDEHEKALGDLRKELEGVVKQRKEHDKELMRAEDLCKQLQPKISRCATD